MPSNTTTARLEARISTDLHAMLKRAAELQGRTMTDFVIAAVRRALSDERAAAFYMHHGFIPMPDAARHFSSRWPARHRSADSHIILK